VTSASGESSSAFHELSRERCEELLATHRAGRVAWNAADGPMVLPVTYAMYTGEIVFRTSPYGALSALANPTNVAFEIDDVDQQAGTGWSVLVRGRAKAVKQAYDVMTLWGTEGIVPWASGTRNLFVAIAPRTITGRAVQAPFARGSTEQGV
jgi:nitroimidazol reductase NimA-like FMN-containing flavoprotein (pyridoxamine 5'-phosphate oxidase superfamily)